ncbi:spermidine synthase [Proteiniborus sp. DW1]|uniref:polyamine aminopropyltransferase n=1 Tax=Proteiniborus sp. DW1 TaxID=1889883 RepID=UPI00092E0089|nr:polyamine aminopropyltransferase [Proteiniborus sp. DW1]SCG81769.1 spermidine synthase [Proteiniborus sp. DW1]
MDLWFTEDHTEYVKFSMKVKEHLFSTKSKFQKIDVIDTYEFGRVLVIDGYLMVTEKDEFIYHDMITHVAMAVNPDIKNVLVIGGGDGGVVRELTRYSSIEKIDMVEIDGEVVHAAKKYLDFTSNKLDDERVTLYIEDGIKFVKDKKALYDLIIVDSTDPIGPGEGLFTTKFYKDCYRILTDKGILINQNESPYYADTAEQMIKATKKLRKVFPIVEVFQCHLPTYASGHWILGFSSKKFHPTRDFNGERWRQIGLDTKYYNTNIHLGSFALPTYVNKMLEAET